MEKLQLHKPAYQLPRVEIFNPSENQKSLILRIMNSSHIMDPEYRLRKDCNAFLQCNSDDYMLIEFWKDNDSAMIEFIDYLNKILFEED